MSTENTETPETLPPALGGGVTTPPAPSSETPPTPSSETPPAPSFLEQLPEDLRGEKCFANVKGTEDLARQFMNAQKLIGLEKVPIPKEGDDQTVWDNFYKASGRPDTPADYKLSEEVTKGLTVDTEAFDNFKKVFHEAGMSQKAFEASVTAYAGYIRSQAEAATAAQTKALDDGLHTLQQEWGGQYDANIAMANDAFEAFADDGFKKLVRESPALSKNPELIKHFVKVGKAISEDRIRDLTVGGKGFAPNSQASALQELQNMEIEHAAILINADTPNQSLRNNLLKRRAELMKVAYPETNR